MSAEHLASDSDDDSEAAPSSESAAPAKPIGELLFRQSHETEQHQPVEAQQHHTFWERLTEKPEQPGLFAELVRDSELDDDDDEAEDSPSSSHSRRDSAAETSHDNAEMSDAELENLSGEEKKTVVGDYVSTRHEQLDAEAEATDADSPEDAATAANALLLDRIDQKLADETKSLEDAIDEAYAETAAEVAGPGEGTAEALPTTPDDAEEEDPAAVTTTTAALHGSTGTTAAVTTLPTPPPAPGGGGRGTTPPGGPPPPPYGGPGGPPYPPFGPFPAGVPGGRAPAPVMPNTAPSSPGYTGEDMREAERRGQISGAVVGGIVGYLLGRRRGRIKTEKRLLPVQEKLEKQVENLHETIASKEQQIRRLAVQKAEAANQAKREATAQQPPTPPKPLVAIPRAANLQPAPEMAASTFIPTPERPSMSLTYAEQPRAAEFVPTPVALQQSAEQPASVVAPEHAEQVKHMSQEELLKTSEKVVIDGNSLRVIYESKQITESGLRHILAEFLSGGNVKNALNEELVVKQLTYERDPHLRDSLSAGYTVAGGATAVQAGQAGVAGANQLSSAQGQQVVQESFAMPRVPQQSDIPNQVEATARRTEQFVVGAWLLVIVTLIILVGILITRRH